MILDKLGEFNLVVRYYFELLDFSKKLKPNSIITNPLRTDGVSLSVLNFVKLRALINTIIVSIGQNFDRIGERDVNGNITPKVSEEDILNEFKDFPYFEELMRENNLTAFETLRQIRNCFLHGHYEIEADVVDSEKLSNSVYTVKVNELNLLIENKKIKGKIPLEDLEELEYICSDIRTLHMPSPKDTYVLFGDNNYLSCKNTFYLERYMQSLKKLNIWGIDDSTQNDNTDEVLQEVQKKYQSNRGIADIVKRNLVKLKKSFRWNVFSVQEDRSQDFEDFKEYYKAYIKYLGLNNFGYLKTKESEYVNKFFNEDVIQSYINQDATVGLIGSFINATTKKITGEDSQGVDLELRKLSYEGPIIYANLLLGLTNYTCGLLRELNGKEAISGLSIFEYHNLGNLDFLNILIDDPQNPSIIRNCSGEEKTQKLENAIKSYEKSIASKKNVLQKIRNKLSKMNDKTPNREQKEREQNEKIQLLEEEIRKVESYVERLKSRKNDYTENYDDYNNFFIHMRNSISHGFYKIDYIDALNSKRLDKIKFVFEDYPESNASAPNFRVEIDAGYLIRLIKVVQSKVNSQIDKENTEYFSSPNVKKTLDASILEKANKDYRITAQELGNATFDGINVHLADEANKIINDAQKQKSTKEDRLHD